MLVDGEVTVKLIETDGPPRVEEGDSDADADYRQKNYRSPIFEDAEGK